MRLIDAHDLMERLYDANPKGRVELAELIETESTVDAVEVVRCKDCKKYIPCQKLPIGTSNWCDLFDRATCEMNYCGRGERREDGQTDNC